MTHCRLGRTSSSVTTVRAPTAAAIFASSSSARPERTTSVEPAAVTAERRLDTACQSASSPDVGDRQNRGGRVVREADGGTGGGRCRKVISTLKRKWSTWETARDGARGEIWAVRTARWDAVIEAVEADHLPSAFARQGWEGGQYRLRWSSWRRKVPGSDMVPHRARPARRDRQRGGRA